MKIKKFLLLLLVLIIISVCLYITLDFFIYTDEERILDILEDCKRAIEEEDILLSSSCLSENYSDVYGLSKGKLLQIGEGVFTKFEDFKVIIDKKAVSVEENVGVLHLSFKIVITYNGQRAFLLGELNSSAKVTLLFERNIENQRGWSISGMRDLDHRWPIEVVKR